MRLGELKNILDKVLTDDNKIVIEQEVQFGGQAYDILNYADLVKALTELKEQVWNITPLDPFDNIVEKYGTTNERITITNQEYNALAQYINGVNAKLPIFYGILENMVDEQDEQIINVKLPDKDDFLLDDLSQINNRLDLLFKEINIDGAYTFKGFDIGTSWYEIAIIGAATYPYFIAALKIAQEYFKAEKAYYESGEARIHYEAAKTDVAKKIADKEVQTFANKVIDSKIDIAINHALEELPKKGNENENRTKMKKTVISITAELNNGLEFHLSLNPPEYAQEDGGRITINYNEIRQIEAAKKEPKQIKKADDGE